MESVSRRKDVREIRARLLLVLLELRCPARCRPRRPWYVPGAVARLGVEGLRRAWRSVLGEEPPCERSVRSHLGLLVKVRALVRSPGDPLEGVEPGPRFRPRHPDTLHLLEDEDALLDWLAVAPAVEARPEARRDVHLWARLAGRWRGGRPRQLEFDFAAASGAAMAARPPDGLADRVGDQKPQGEALRRALGAVLENPAHDALELQRALAASGVVLRGRPSFELAADVGRLRGSASLLALAMARGDAIRNPAAWLVRAHRHARPAELVAARAWALGYARTERSPP